MSVSGLGLAAKLPQHGLIIITWCGVGLAAVLVAARTAIRVKKIEKLHTDDYFIYTAFLFLVLNAILQTLQAPHCYNLARVLAGLSEDTEEAVMASGNIYVRYEFTIIGFFWTTLWLVKGSFLAFFYRLFSGLQVYKRIWWGVVVFAFLSYIGCWIVSINVCHPASSYFDFGACTSALDKQTSISAQADPQLCASVGTTAYFVTVMALPMNLLWKVRISPTEKKGLAVVFSIGFLIVIFSITRAIQIAVTTTTDPVLLALWGIIESTVSVIVGCLPPFKSLFGKPKDSSAYNYSKNNMANELRSGSIPLGSCNVQTTKIRATRVRDEYRSESMEDIVQSPQEYPKRIFVRQEIHQIRS